MPFGIGPLELTVVLVLAFLVFGPKRLPEVARSAGRGMREFKDTVSGLDVADDHDRRAPAAQLAEGSSLEAVPTTTRTTTSQPTRA